MSVDGELFYSSGQLLVRGGANTALRMTPMSEVQVRLENDANGDGTFEFYKSAYWVDLL